MNKKFLLLVLAVLMVFSFALAAHAGTTTSASTNMTAQFVIGQASYTVDGTVYNMDASPLIQDGRTLVPVRYLADALGAQTAWDATSQTVTVTAGSTTIDLVIGSTTLTVNGQTSTMDVAPVITDGRTYLPARYVAEALGATVDWDATTQTVTLTWPAPAAPTTTTTTTTTTTAPTPAAPTTPVVSSNKFEAWLQTQPSLYDPKAVPGYNCLYQFDVTDTADAGLYWIKVDNSVCTVGDGAVTNPDCTITTPEQVWLDVSADTLAGSPKSLGMTDYLTGVYKVADPSGKGLTNMAIMFHNPS